MIIGFDDWNGRKGFMDSMTNQLERAKKVQDNTSQRQRLEELIRRHRAELEAYEDQLESVMDGERLHWLQTRSRGSAIWFTVTGEQPGPRRPDVPEYFARKLESGEWWLFGSGDNTGQEIDDQGMANLLHNKNGYVVGDTMELTYRR